MQVSLDHCWEEPLDSTMELFWLDLESLYFGETVLVQFYWTSEKWQTAENISAKPEVKTVNRI